MEKRVVAARLGDTECRALDRAVQNGRTTIAVYIEQAVLARLTREGYLRLVAEDTAPTETPKCPDR